MLKKQLIIILKLIIIWEIYHRKNINLRFILTNFNARKACDALTPPPPYHHVSRPINIWFISQKNFKRDGIEWGVGQIGATRSWDKWRHAHLRVEIGLHFVRSEPFRSLHGVTNLLLAIIPQVTDPVASWSHKATRSGGLGGRDTSGSSFSHWSTVSSLPHVLSY